MNLDQRFEALKDRLEAYGNAEGTEAQGLRTLALLETAFAVMDEETKGCFLEDAELELSDIAEEGN